MLVAIGESAIDQCRRVLLARLDILCHWPSAKAGVQRAARLPGVMQRRTCGGFADIGDYPAKCPETSDAMNKNNCRQPVVGVCQITWRSALGQRNRFADWAEFFGEELRRAPWPEVLDRWDGAADARV